MTVNRGRSMKSGRGDMAAPAKRIDGIDFWRGFALLTIFIDHVPENVFQHVTQQNSLHRQGGGLMLRSSATTFLFKFTLIEDCVDLHRRYHDVDPTRDVSFSKR